MGETSNNQTRLVDSVSTGSAANASDSQDDYGAYSYLSDSGLSDDQKTAKKNNDALSRFNINTQLYNLQNQKEATQRTLNQNQKQWKSNIESARQQSSGDYYRALKQMANTQFAAASKAGNAAMYSNSRDNLTRSGNNTQSDIRGSALDGLLANMSEIDRNKYQADSQAINTYNSMVGDVYAALRDIIANNFADSANIDSQLVDGMLSDKWGIDTSSMDWLTKDTSNLTRSSFMKDNRMANATMPTHSWTITNNDVQGRIPNSTNNLASKSSNKSYKNKTMNRNNIDFNSSYWNNRANGGGGRY